MKLWFLVLNVVLLAESFPAAAQTFAPPDRVLAFRPTMVSGRPLGYDAGAAGAWQRIVELRTTASVLHTAAHPDDEHTGLLTRLSRGEGVRTALLTINRGEGGANAVGPELFDALGVIRAEELRLAGTYYGLDDLYFTTAIDYGFSKTLDEARASWDWDAVLEDMVRIIRINRPLVVVSRWHGSPRDGHGHHQASGVLTLEAVGLAAEPTAFPEQIAREGLRPWQVKRLYRGGIRPGETTDAVFDASGYDPVLGASYDEIGRLGVSLQRSQTAGRMRASVGPTVYRYERMDRGRRTESDSDLFEGLSTSLSGLPALTGESVPASLQQSLDELEALVEEVVSSFSFADPASSVAGLARGLDLTRRIVTSITNQVEMRFMLLIKERQFERAIAAALGLSADALVRVEASMGIAALETVTPGQGFYVDLVVRNPSDVDVRLERFDAVGAEAWRWEQAPGTGRAVRSGAFATSVAVQVPWDRDSRPYISRGSIAENRYTVRDSADLYLPAPRPPVVVRWRLSAFGVPFSIEAPLRVRVADLPNGYVYPELTVTPPVSLALDPDLLVVASDAGSVRKSFRVVVTNRDARGATGTLRLEVPAGVTVEPAAAAFTLERAGEEAAVPFTVTSDGRADVPVTAHARIGDVDVRDGFEALRHRDLEVRYLDRPARGLIRRVDVRVAPNLEVGYVMGVGDAVPAAIEQLGATVRLLGAQDLADGSLDAFDAIVIGTRAYAVRPDLVAHNGRLLEYAERGGNLVVLYQTQEFVPREMAPFAAELPPGAEEVSEEDAPVTLLDPRHPAVTTPNVITARDFDGWIEQRGSKFFTTWADEYTPLIETRDTGQDPQRGVWLTARVGAGHYSYVALALHRQVPYGVAGAYRILANLLSMRAMR